MSSKTKTVSYSTVDEKRDLPFTKELELASLFILAESHIEKEPLSAIVQVYYPLRIKRWRDGALLLDLLGLNHTSVRYNLIPNVEDFERALESLSEEPVVFLTELKERGTMFEGFADRETIRINGLIPQKGKSKEFSEIIGDLHDFEPADNTFVFKPVLKDNDIESIIGSIFSLQEDIERDLKLLERAKRSMEGDSDIAKKVLIEEMQNIRDRNSKVNARLKKEVEKVKVKHQKSLKIDLGKIKREYSRKVTPLRQERKKLTSKLRRRRKKLDLYKANREFAAAKKVSKEIGELETKLEKVQNTIKPLEAWRNAEMDKARAENKLTIEVENDKVKEETAQGQIDTQSKREEISELEEAVKDVSTHINGLLKSKKSKLNSFARFRFDVDMEDIDVYLPFYIFQYGEDKFRYHPPVVACGARGLLSRFRRMLADNLQSKMNQLIKSRIPFMEKYFERGVKNLGKKSDLTVEFLAARARFNLLESRDAVDKMMTGLIKIRREGWISDSEYIRFQENLVENLGLISRP